MEVLTNDEQAKQLLEQHTVKKLREKLRELGMKVGGLKSELVGRLLLNSTYQQPSSLSSCQQSSSLSSSPFRPNKRRKTVSQTPHFSSPLSTHNTTSTSSSLSHKRRDASIHKENESNTASERTSAGEKSVQFKEKVKQVEMEQVEMEQVEMEESEEEKQKQMSKTQTRLEVLEEEKEAPFTREEKETQAGDTCLQEESVKEEKEESMKEESMKGESMKEESMKRVKKVSFKEVQVRKYKITHAGSCGTPTKGGFPLGLSWNFHPTPSILSVDDYGNLSFSPFLFFPFSLSFSLSN